MKIGERVQAKVIECIEDGSLILSFQGSLLRVVNQTGISYQVNSTVTLEVQRLRPLEFKLLAKKSQFSINI